MKKSVILMAGLLAMALAGSAQATGTPMFAVQDATGTTDMMVVDQTGWVGIGTSAPTTPFHAVVSGTGFNSAGFTYSWTNTGASKKAFIAPNFSFTRNNATNLVASGFPVKNDALGLINFGALDGTAILKSAQIGGYADDVFTSTSAPTALVFNTTSSGSILFSERMRIDSFGNIGIGLVPPAGSASKLHVSGLPTFTDNAAATAALLTPGALYKTPTGQLMIVF